MTQPSADRPYMPGYGIQGPGEGMLPWSWAVRQLNAAKYYFVCTVGPDGRPYASPVWAIWHDDRLLFSCAPRSRKARNLATNPHCAVTTDDGAEPVLIEGVAELIGDRDLLETMRVAMVAKYDSPLSLEFILANSAFSIGPTKLIGLSEEDFTGSPTRWTPA